MNRRDFLTYSAASVATVLAARQSVFAAWLETDAIFEFPQRRLLIDAHAHPDIFPCNENWCDQASTIEKIAQLRMNLSSFAVTGDHTTETACVKYSFDETRSRLRGIVGFETQGRIRIVRRVADIPEYAPLTQFVPGALLGLEGAGPLISPDIGAAGVPPLEVVRARIDALYDLGVRCITVMHYCSNELGSAMSDVLPPGAGGLTTLGRAVVIALMKKGIIVDAAHAHITTLRDIVTLALRHGVPIVDSHTSLGHTSNNGSRRRTIEEMQWIARTGGVVCTWPVQVCLPDGSSCPRNSIEDWAGENLMIAREIGAEHIGLGTDGGGIGNLANLVEGYTSILDLPELADAMRKVAFTRQEIAAYMGRNVLRVLARCVG
jgi:microsomal dipeptidase-like Zn-dependent dipeptidase